jgi:nicotinate-nucleotide adenylyltransferase
MKTGLYFGSFNPIHIGHLAIANYIVEYTSLNNIWFVVSPHNPLKKKENLLSGHDRLKMVELAVGDDSFRLRPSDIEMQLPVPSYTIDTISYLKERYHETEFSLIMGEDNLYTLHKWKNAEALVKSCEIFVYPRPGTIKPHVKELDEIIQKARITVVNAPLMNISGTFIREALVEGKDIRHFLPPGVYEYLIKNNFYPPESRR